MRMKKIFLLFIIFFLPAFGSGSLTIAQKKDDINLSGKLSFDSKLSYENSQKVLIDNQYSLNGERKSPILAAALSFALPGAGEFYTESYWKTALFVVAEVAAITIGLVYDKKGDGQTVSFQNFANAHWDVKRYALWTITNAKNIKADINPNDFSVFDSKGNVNWSELNRLESALGSYYSHRLAPFGDQQYYEIIGKYPQFNVGWDDFGDENTPFTYGDPLTPNFIYYSKERGKANDLYNVASTAMIVVIANHILSAADAAWSASSYNKNLELSAEIKKFDMGFRTVYYPQLNLQYRF